MKVILEFNLPEETESYQLAMNGHRYRFALQELDNYLRSELKYNDALNKGSRRLLDAIRAKLREELHERGVTLYE
jgi:hypothetical protein